MDRYGRERRNPAGNGEASSEKKGNNKTGIGVPFVREHDSKRKAKEVSDQEKKLRREGRVEEWHYILGCHQDVRIVERNETGTEAVF